MGCGQSKNVVSPQSQVSCRQSTDKDPKRQAFPVQKHVSPLQAKDNNQQNHPVKSPVSVTDGQSITWQDKVSKEGSENCNHDFTKCRETQADQCSTFQQEKKSRGVLPDDDILSGQDEEHEEVYDIPQIPQDVYQPFVEFPTPHLLREANREYTTLTKGNPFPYKDETKLELLPYPTPTAKKDIIQLKDFHELDNHAITTPAELKQGSLQNLVQYLCRYAKSDLAKVRVMFRWITAQSLIQIDANEEVVDGTPQGYLIRLKQDRGDYSSLFVDMCRAAGLQAEKIMGLVKGEDYNVGEEVPSDSAGSWTGVVVEKEWRLFDPHWAARHVSGGSFGEWELIDDNGKGAKELKEEDKYMNYHHNESYFLTDPEEMVYSHFPLKHEQWQMLARPISKREFDEMVHLKPAFFDLDLMLGSYRKCSLHAPEGEIEIDLNLPQQRRRFMYRLWKSNKDKEREETVGDYKLDRFVFMQQLGNSLLTKLYFPCAGKFKFELFARDAENEEAGPNQTYQMVCTYIVQSDMAKDDIQPFPENQRKEWGPGQDLEHAGLHPVSHHDAIVEAEEGTVQLRLKADKAVDLIHKLHSNTLSESKLKDYVVHYTDGEDIVLNVKLPESGEYALNIYAKDAGVEGTLPNVCSYLLTSDQSAFDPTPFPSLVDGNVGKTDPGKALGVDCTSHNTAFIEAPESGELEIDLQLSGPCNLKGNLNLQKGTEAVNMDQYVFLTQDLNDNAKFRLQLPEAGMYSLKVYGKSTNTKGVSMPNIYNFLIKVPTPKENCTPFPKSFTIFSSNKCQIQAPMAGTLPSNAAVPFAVNVPNASKVATIGSKGWTQLQKDEDGWWKGNAQTGNPGTELKLAAEMTQDSNSFETLLVYEVADPTDITKREEKQLKVKTNAKKKQSEEKARKQKRRDDVKETHTALLQAMQDRDRKGIKKLLKYIEKKRYVSPMRDDVTKAKDLLRSIDRIEALCHAILNMDKATIAEIRRYTNPPKLVHEVMVASLLLLGDHEGKTRNWQQCQKLCNTLGPQGLLKRVKEFDVTQLHPEIAARVHLLISQYRLDDVTDKSAGAATFYAWALGMTEELKLVNPAGGRASPAGLKRQKELFK